MRVIMKKKILIIIPAYNEEKNIVKTINSIKNYKKINLDYIVINDGSIDTTKKVMEENDIDFIMAGHINTPNATTDGLPASLSYQMLTEQLRNHLGFEGIIITDALDMAAVTKYANAPLMAIQAGADMALMPVDIEKAHTDILTALKQGTLSEDTLNEKVKRILSLKYDKGYFQKEL